VYAGLNHAPVKGEPLTGELLRGATFVAVAEMPELADYAISVRCESIDIAIRLCTTSARLCVLPDVEWPSLVRLTGVAEPIPLHVIQREPLNTGREDARLAAVVAMLTAAVRRVSPGST